MSEEERYLLQLLLELRELRGEVEALAASTEEALAEAQRRRAWWRVPW